MGQDVIRYGPFPVRWDLVWAALAMVGLAVGGIWWEVDGESLRCDRHAGAGRCAVQRDGPFTAPEVTARFRVGEVRAVRFRSWVAGKGGERGETILSLADNREVRFGAGPEAEARERFNAVRNFFATRDDGALELDEPIGWTFWPLVGGLLGGALALLAWVAWARLRRDLRVVPAGAHGPRRLRVTARLAGLPVWTRRHPLDGVRGVVVDFARRRHLGDGRSIPAPWAARVTLRFDGGEMLPLVRPLHRDVPGAERVAGKLLVALGLGALGHDAGQGDEAAR